MRQKCLIEGKARLGFSELGFRHKRPVETLGVAHTETSLLFSYVNPD